MTEKKDFAEQLADAMMQPLDQIGGLLARQIDELNGRVLLLENAVRLLLRERNPQVPEPIASRKTPNLRSVE